MRQVVRLCSDWDPIKTLSTSHQTTPKTAVSKGGNQPPLGGFAYLHNAIDDVFKSSIAKSFTGDHKQSILEESCWTGVCVSATQHDIVSSVQGAIFTLQSVQDLQGKKKKKNRTKKTDNKREGSDKPRQCSLSMTSLMSGPLFHAWTHHQRNNCKSYHFIDSCHLQAQY